MNNVIPLVEVDKDIWTFAASDDLSAYTFYFNFLPNEWFKETIKKITKESIIIGKLKLSTLHRYNYSLEKFFLYLKSYDINLATFGDVTFDLVEGYIHYLLESEKKPSTRVVALAALKHHIKHGQSFEYSGFPRFEVFDGTEMRTLQTEDTLKSRLIDDDVMKSIDFALNRMGKSLKPTLDNLNKIVLWALITVVRHTGIRLSEALSLNFNCLRKDLIKKYVLEVVSSKNETERFIPVSQDVVEALNFLIKTTGEIRSALNTDKIFIYYQTTKKKYKLLSQRYSRQWLRSKFIKRFDIRDSNGNLAIITFHQFRHQIGTDMLNDGQTIFEIMQYLGHESMHSTRLYAKVRNDKLSKEYKKLGFIGVIESTVNDIVGENGHQLDNEKRLMAQLPDGICAKPINKKVVNCKKPNACLFCPKFITTPEFLGVHKNHLERILADKERYMGMELFGNDYLLSETEKVLKEIINRLEAMKEVEIVE